MLQVLGVFHSSCCIYSDATRWHLSTWWQLFWSTVAMFLLLLVLRVAPTWLLSTEGTAEASALLLTPANTGARDANAW